MNLRLWLRGATENAIAGGSTATSTPALVASVAAGAGADSVTTAAIDTTGATFIIAAVSYNTGATPTITDSKGNTWTPLTASTVTGSVTERLYYAANPAVGTGHTFSNTATSNFSSICVAAFNGVATSSPLDKENGATSSLSTIQTGSVTPAVNQELVATGLGWNVARTTYPPTIDSGFTVSTSSNFASGNHYGCSIGFLSQATSSAVNPTWNLGIAQSDAARIAAFRPLVTPGGGSGTTASTTIRYIATDNLTGANIVLDASGGVAEAQDFTPYGGIRMDTKTNYGGVRNKYAGTVYDALSGLNYAQARYQNSSRGQFISEDPLFVGGPMPDLANPQNQNSYSYSNDNPITKSDPTGKDAYDYSRPVSKSGFLSNFNHAFVYVVPAPGETLPSINSNGMCIALPDCGVPNGNKLIVVEYPLAFACFWYFNAFEWGVLHVSSRRSDTPTEKRATDS